MAADGISPADMVLTEVPIAGAAPQVGWQEPERKNISKLFFMNCPAVRSVTGRIDIKDEMVSEEIST